MTPTRLAAGRKHFFAHSILVIGFVAIVTIVLLSTPNILPFTITITPKNNDIAATTTAATSTCDFPIVYNKSPKTASSFLKDVITKWSKSVGRPPFNCPPNSLPTTVLIRDCIPEGTHPCGVLTTHIILDTFTRTILQQRLPRYKFIASTRYPPHRILSLYMFTRNKRDDDPDLEEKLTYFLKAYNPWHQYNYFTGEERMGACPITLYETRQIASLVARMDIVLDVNLREESNAILRHFKLFEIPPPPKLSDRPKEFGAVRANISQDNINLLKKKLCVEVEMHRAMQYRMASLYEKATGVKCLRGNTMRTCLADAEEKFLQSSWTIELNMKRFE